MKPAKVRLRWRPILEGNCAGEEGWLTMIVHLRFLEYEADQ